MIATHDITIFNSRLDKTTRRETYVPTNIFGISFSGVHSFSGSSERVENDRYTIRIPVNTTVQDNREYIPEEQYKLLDDEEVCKYWTLQKGCLIAIGTAISNDEIITRDTFQSFQDIIRRSNGIIITVNEYADNTTRGSDSVKHWRIGGA